MADRQIMAGEPKLPPQQRTLHGFSTLLQESPPEAEAPQEGSDNGQRRPAAATGSGQARAGCFRSYVVMKGT